MLNWPGRKEILDLTVFGNQAQREGIVRLVPHPVNAVHLRDHGVRVESLEDFIVQSLWP